VASTCRQHRGGWPALIRTSGVSDQGDEAR